MTVPCMTVPNQVQRAGLLPPASTDVLTLFFAHYAYSYITTNMNIHDVWSHSCLHSSIHIHTCTPPDTAPEAAYSAVIIRMTGLDCSLLKKIYVNRTALQKDVGWFINGYLWLLSMVSKYIMFFIIDYWLNIKQMVVKWFLCNYGLLINHWIVVYTNPTSYTLLGITLI